MAWNVCWQLGGGKDLDGAVETGNELVDVETGFLEEMSGVVGRLVDDEWRLLRHIQQDIVNAAVAQCYVLVATGNAALRAHAAVHRLQPPPISTMTQWTSVLLQQPSFDLRRLADVIFIFLFLCD